jgi:hypothetical protein
VKETAANISSSSNWPGHCEMKKQLFSFGMRTNLVLFGRTPLRFVVGWLESFLFNFLIPEFSMGLVSWWHDFVIDCFNFFVLRSITAPTVCLRCKIVKFFSPFRNVHETRLAF